MSAMVSQITSLAIVYSTVYSGADQSRHQNNASLIVGNSPVTGEFPHKGPVTQKMFPLDDVIMHMSHDVHCMHSLENSLEIMYFLTYILTGVLGHVLQFMKTLRHVLVITSYSLCEMPLLIHAPYFILFSQMSIEAKTLIEEEIHPVVLCEYNYLSMR